MKRIVVLLLTVLVLAAVTSVILSGCVAVHRDNAEFEHSAFLSYSLGDYTAEREKYIKGHSPIPAADHGYEWTAAYTDTQGMERAFVFNNVEDFGEQVCSYVKGLADEEIRAGYVEPYFGEQESSGIISIWVISEIPFENEQRENYMESVIRPKSGIRIAGITAAELQRNWQFEYSFTGRMDTENESEIEQLKQRAASFIDELTDYFGNNDVYFNLDGKDTDHSYIYKWDDARGKYDWFVAGDILDESNTIDGRLTLVRNLKINDTLIADADLKWNGETGEYHVDPYYVKRTLDILGIPYETVDSGKGIFEWKVGDDIIEMNQRDGTVLKNGLNIIAYEFDTMVDINLSVYEEMTGTVAVLDGNTMCVELK